MIKKKIIAIVLVAILAFNTGAMAEASVVPTVTTEEALISSLIGNYMDARQQLLMDEENELSEYAVSGIVRDEERHAEALDSSGYQVLNCSYQISEVNAYDNYVEAEVIEYIVFTNNLAETVAHYLTLYPDNSSQYIVASDRYYEATTGFSSASYVPENGVSPRAISGSSTCITWVARQELGYLEKASNYDLYNPTGNPGTNNYTKYGAWYGINPGEWCAMFVSWCANQADIPTNIIPLYASCTIGMNDFITKNLFHYSQEYGGNYTPKEGDIFFTGGSATSSSHTGIVLSVSGTTFTTIEGNSNNQVKSNTFTLADTSLIGFASPAYTSTGHTWVASGLYYVCSHCGAVQTT